MKKNIILCSIFLAFTAAHAQIKVGSNPTSISTNANLEVESNTSSRFIVTKDSSKVGIGTLTPAAKLDVAGKVKITDGSQGNGKIFVSNALGVGSWVTPASALSGSVKDSTTASNGLTLNGKNVELGGSLSKSTILTTSASNTLAINGLQKGNTTDSILVVNPSTGILKSVSPTTIGAASEPWNNVATNSGANSNVQNIYQMGNVGVKDSVPTSTLDVNGSFALKYSSITSTNYSIGNEDYYLSYNGTANATFTLPAGTISTCNCNGRVYEIINSSSFTITLTANTSELVDNLSSLKIGSNQTIKLVNIGASSGNTWITITSGLRKSSNSGTFSIVSMAFNGKTNTEQSMSASVSTQINNTDLVVTVPSGYASNRVVLRWDLWGHAFAANNANWGWGALWFTVENVGNVIYGVSAVQTVVITPSVAPTRWSSPVAYYLTNLAPGVYTFRLRAQFIDPNNCNAIGIFGITGQATVSVENP